MPKDVNWTKRVQPKEGEPTFRIGTIVEGGNPERFLEGEALNTRDASSNGSADGDNPSYAMPPFADGKDLRNRG